VDLNYLRTSDKFIQGIVHFYPLDSAIQASYNAIFTPDKIYPLDSDLSTFNFVQTANGYLSCT
jgi:hypothetical protein